MKKILRTAVILIIVSTCFLLCRPGAATDGYYAEENEVDFYQPGPYAVDVFTIARPPLLHRSLYTAPLS